MVTNNDFVARHEELKRGFRALHHAVPRTMSGFASMHGAAIEDGALSTATKELIALAIGIAGHCEGCIAFHVHDALAAGATRQQIEETIAVAIFMGGGPSAVYGCDALTALDQFEAQAAAVSPS
jgi:AhpD family alkylhydroperoxidase